MSQHKGKLLSGFISSNAELTDELGRAPFAEGVIQLITNHTDNNCMILGIEGAWGEGKTHTIQLIKQSLTKHEKILCIDFNPWYFSNREHLAELFLNNFSSTLNEQSLNRWDLIRRRMKSSLKPILRRFLCLTKSSHLTKLVLGGIGLALLLVMAAFDQIIPVSILSIIGFIGTYFLSSKAVDDVTEIADLMGDYADVIDNKKSANKTLLQIKKEIDTKLKDTEFKYSRIVVFIEDLDRLPPEEVREIVQLMRMVADFPKVTYVVGYDRLQVIRALGEMAGRHTSPEDSLAFGEGYLQKIIHAAFQLPTPPQYAVAEVIFNKWIELAKEFYKEDFTKREYWQKVRPLLIPFFSTIRDGEKIINRAFLIMLMLKEKSNPADVLIAAYFMEYQPKLWGWLWHNQRSLFRGARKLISDNPPSHQDLSLKNTIIENNVTQQSIINILRIAFPAFRYDSWQVSPSEIENYRICSTRHFESYFRYEISTSVKATQSIDKLFSKKKHDRTSLLDEIWSSGEDAIYNTFQQLDEKINNIDYLEWRSKWLPLLADMGEIFDNKRCIEDGLSLAPAERVMMISTKIINQLELSRRGDAMLELISMWGKCNAIYLTMSLVDLFAAHHKWKGYENRAPAGGYELKVSLSQKETQLATTTNKKIQEWTQNSTDRFLSHSHCGAMLFMWLRLDYNLARRVIDNWLIDNWKLFKVMNALLATRYSRELSTEQGTVKTKFIQADNLSKITNMSNEKVISRIRDAILINPHAASDFPDVMLAIDELEQEVVQ